jgi:uncharacterized protein YraI
VRVPLGRLRRSVVVAVVTAAGVVALSSAAGVAAASVSAHAASIKGCPASFHPTVLDPPDNLTQTDAGVGTVITDVVGTICWNGKTVWEGTPLNDSTILTHAPLTAANSIDGCGVDFLDGLKGPDYHPPGVTVSLSWCGVTYNRAHTVIAQGLNGCILIQPKVAGWSVLTHIAFSGRYYYTDEGVLSEPDFAKQNQWSGVKAGGCPPSPSAPAITTQPTSQAVGTNAGVVVTASASGSPAPSVQWQISTGASASWSNISGATSNAYWFDPVVADSGYEYRAVFTNAVGSATTSAATITVTVSPVPTAACTAVKGGTYQASCPWTVKTYHVVGSGSSGIAERSGPGTQFPTTTRLPSGSAAPIACQIKNSSVVETSSVWDLLANGEWVSDYYINTPVVNEYTTGIPVCVATTPTTPITPAPVTPVPTPPVACTPLKSDLYQVLCPWTVKTYHVVGSGSSGIAERSGPGTQFATTARLAAGAAAPIACQLKNSSVVETSSVWDLLTNGLWVSDYYISTPVVDQYTAGIARCVPLPPPRVTN